MKYLLLISAACLTGCSVITEPPSAIVQKAQACGAGDLAAASTSAIQDWFSKHRECAVTIEAMCKPVRNAAPAAWADSTEGRVCTSARSIAQWVRKASQDHERFQAGWK